MQSVSDMELLSRPPEVPKKYLRVRDVASRLSLSRAMVYKLVRSGKLKAHRINNTVIIPESEIDRLLSESWERSSSEKASG